MLPEGAKVSSVLRGFLYFSNIEVTPILFTIATLLPNTLPSCQEVNTDVDIRPIYGELYLLPTALVQERWPLPHIKAQQRHSEKSSNSSRTCSKHRCCCGVLLQLLLRSPSRNTSSRTTAAAVRTASQQTTTYSIRPNYCENRTRTVCALSHPILRTGSNRDSAGMSCIAHLVPDTHLISIGNTEQPQCTPDMGRILSVNPEMFMLDIHVTHTAVSTTAQNPHILRVLAVGASSLRPSGTSSSARRNNLTRFSPETGAVEHHILYPVRRIVYLKRVRLSHFCSKYLASGYTQ